MVATVQQFAQKFTQQYRQGNFSGALKTAKTAMKKFPREANFPNMAGMALGNANNPREAALYFAKAVKLRPGDVDMQDNLLQSLVLSDQHDKAAVLIEKYKVSQKNVKQLFTLEALMHVRRGDFKAVIQATDRAIQYNPNEARVWNLRGIALYQQKDFRASIASYQRSIKLDPRNPEPLTNIALPLCMLIRVDEATEYLRRALAINPNHINANHRLAVQLSQIGDFEGSKEAYRKVVKLDPNNVEALKELIQTQTPEENSPLEKALAAKISKASAKSAQYPHLYFAMAYLKQQAGDKMGAAPYFARANAAESALRPHNRAASVKLYEDTITHFTANQSGADTLLPQPIFVLGQPRSGTTLSEMIISAHPKVHSLGELPAAGNILHKMNFDFQSFDPQIYADEYRKALPDTPEGTRFFVDKMPANYERIGPLLWAFDGARVLHIARDPRDVALSMWRAYFSSKGLNYTFDMGHMAHEANLYRRFMNHWEAVFPDRVLTLDYSDITADVRASGQKMADFCGLDWVDDMAAPEKNTAAVRTASITQVREGVHRKSVGGWQAFSEYLQPFVDGLDPELWPELNLND